MELSRVTEAMRSLGTGFKGISGDKYSGIDWEEEPTFSEEEFNTKITELQAEYDAQKYARDRALAYDSVGNQLDMLMKDMKNNTKTHQEACEAVKARFPKP